MFVEKKIRLNAINDVKEFVNIVSKGCAYDVDVQSGSYIVDGKSLMGIFSLDLSKTIKVVFHVNSESDIPVELNKFFI